MAQRCEQLFVAFLFFRLTPCDAQDRVLSRAMEGGAMEGRWALMIQMMERKAAQLRRELREVESAIAVVHRYADTAEGTAPAPRPKPQTLAAAIREALGDLGSATSAQVYEYVHSVYDPDANRGTVPRLVSSFVKAITIDWLMQLMRTALPRKRNEVSLSVSRAE